MAKGDSAKSLDNALAHVNQGRRGFLKGLLVGSAALAALPLITSTVMAQDTTPPPPAKGKGKGKGKGAAPDAAPAAPDANAPPADGGGKGKGKGKGKGAAPPATTP